jgi:protein subunit release factor B
MLFPVSESKTENLLRAMARVGIREADLEESFIHSGGPGGQNVNKVSTCVVLKHLPSGMTVKCQQERSQAMNRYRARWILAARLEERIKGRQSETAKRIAKIKRQKRKRSKRAKDKMLAAKRVQGEKKQLRRRVAED